MKKNAILNLIFAAALVSSCSKESPELIPCMCDGTESTLGLFDCMCEPMKRRPVKRITYIQDQPSYVRNQQPQMTIKNIYIDDEQRDAYLYLHQRRDSFAPIKLAHVDFRIKKGQKYDNFDTKLGNYRFRIFGCRREAKNVFLNKGRAMQKDMRFFDVFFEQMNDYYPVVVDKSNPYYLESDRIEHPEYVITAEITDYFMNICDEFDWDAVKNKKLRSGSSEMTVTWRVMNLARDEVYCKGTTTGYGQISEGEPNGETLLVERSFEDALNKLPEVGCFNKTLAQRIRPEDIERQLAYLQKQERLRDTFNAQYERELKGITLLQECASGLTKAPKRKNQTYIVDGQAKGSGYADEYGYDYDYDADGVSARVKTSVARKGRHGGTGGLSIDDRCRAVELGDDGCTVVKNTEKKNVTIADDYWIDVPLNTTLPQVVEKRREADDSFSRSFNRFCIENQPPYKNLNPHNLYKVRASIVSVANPAGKKGAGLIIADNLILTSADLMVKDDNNFDIETINGKKFKARGMRVNPKKNVAVLLLDEPTQYTPLPLSLSLPEVNRDVLMTLGLLDLQNEGEGYIDNQGKVIGYRWSEERGVEIIVDTFVQSVALGSSLVDKNGNIVGLAHDAKKEEATPDLFIPIESALKSLGIEICGRQFTEQKPVITEKCNGKKCTTVVTEETIIEEDPKEETSIIETSGAVTSSSVRTEVKPMAKKVAVKQPAPQPMVKEVKKVKSVKLETALADAIDNAKADKAPEPMKGLEKK